MLLFTSISNQIICLQVLNLASEVKRLALKGILETNQVCWGNPTQNLKVQAQTI